MSSTFYNFSSFVNNLLINSAQELPVHISEIDWIFVYQITNLSGGVCHGEN